MTREIVLDTETTGLDPTQGHRIIELACVEIYDFLPTGQSFHAYIDPERLIDPEAERVHGISNAFLKGRPHFADPAVVEAFLEFIGPSPLVAHNASFDRAFVDHELQRAGREPTEQGRWVDTLGLAQKRFPGMYNSLDALCKRFRLSLAERERHGARVDAQLLAQVYLELRGGRERTLDLACAARPGLAQTAVRVAYGARPRPLLCGLTASDLAAHEAFVSQALGPDALWLRSAA